MGTQGTDAEARKRKNLILAVVHAMLAVAILGAFVWAQIS